MDSIQVFVEGSGDVIFLRHLLSNIEPSLRGAWKKCVDKGFDDNFDESQMQPPTLTYRVEWKNRLIVIRAMNGVDNIFPMPEPMLTTFGYNVGVDGVTIKKNVFIVDADDSTRGNGSGGIASVKMKIRKQMDVCSRLGVACAGFAMPDNESDGALENLLEAMIPSANRAVHCVCWEGFKACAKSHGAKYDPPLKSWIDVYSKMFSAKARGSMFASPSFGDSSVWDWNSPILDSLKSFLNSEVLG